MPWSREVRGLAVSCWLAWGDAANTVLSRGASSQGTSTAGARHEGLHQSSPSRSEAQPALVPPKAAGALAKQRGLRVSDCIGANPDPRLLRTPPQPLPRRLPPQPPGPGEAPGRRCPSGRAVPCRAGAGPGSRALPGRCGGPGGGPGDAGAARGAGGAGAAAGGGAGPGPGPAAPAVPGLQAAVPPAGGPRLLPPLRSLRLLRAAAGPGAAAALLPPERAPRRAHVRRLRRAPAGAALPGEGQLLGTGGLRLHGGVLARRGLQVGRAAGCLSSGRRGHRWSSARSQAGLPWPTSGCARVGVSAGVCSPGAPVHQQVARWSFGPLAGV